MEPQRKIAIAEHLLTKSYPALNDPKVLLSALKNALGAIEDKISITLKEAREEHEIPPYGDTFNQKLNAYRMHLAKKRGVGKVDLMMISEMQELLIEHDNSPTAFRRKESFVIADNDFNLKTLDPKKTKTYISRTKSLLPRL